MKMKNLFALVIILVNLSIANAQWQKTNGPFHSNIKAFARNGSNLYAAGESDGVFVSTNNGSDWAAINNGLPAHAIYYSLAVEETTLFLGSNNGVFLSIDGGANWMEKNNGLPENTRVYSFLIDGANVYAGTTKGLFLSNNNGDSWGTANNGLPVDTPIIGSLVKNGSDLWAGTSSGIFLSNDNGNNWTAMNNGLPSSIFIYSFAIEESNIYAGTSDGVYLSNDNGISWAAMNNGLTESLVFWLEVSETNIYAGTPIGLFTSTNNGNSWSLLKNGQTGIGQINSRTAAIMINGGDIFAGGNDGICVSTDGGASWVNKNNGLPYASLYTLATNGEVVYAGTEKGLYVSNDNGNIWHRKFNYFTTSVKARDANVFIGSIPGKIYVSNDFGNSWIQSAGFWDNGEEVIALAGTTAFAKYNIGPFNEGTGYISIDNGTSFMPYDFPYTVFANNDDASLFAVDNTVLAYNGDQWIPESAAINDTVYALAVNNNGFLVGTDGGVLTTTFNGSSWTKVPFGLENAKVTDLVVNGSNVYACTSNNEIYASADDGDNWTAITDNFLDTLITKKPHGILVTQMLINNTHIFVGAKEGIWSRPLSEITPVKEPNTSAQFTIYPNPSNGRFLISGKKIDALEIHNALGEIVYSESGLISGTREINLSAFPRGVYFVTVSSNGKNYCKKVMVNYLF